MKKPFRHSKIGKLLTSPIVKGLLTKIPFDIGSTIGDLLNKNETEEGAMTKEKLMHHVIKIVMYGVLAYFFLKGDITLDEAEDAKDLINN